MFTLPVRPRRRPQRARSHASAVRAEGGAILRSFASAGTSYCCGLRIARSDATTVGTVATHHAPLPGRAMHGGEPTSACPGGGTIMSEKPGDVRVAFYARVSSDQQADSGTIASQIRALRER